MGLVEIGFDVLKLVLSGLSARASNTTNPAKRMLFREIRENLKILQDRRRMNYGNFIVTELSNQSIIDAIRQDVKFNRLKKRKLKKETVQSYGFTSYEDWSVEKLVHSIDEKITDLKRWHKRFPDIYDAPIQLTSRLNNLDRQLKYLSLILVGRP